MQDGAAFLAGGFQRIAAGVVGQREGTRSWERAVADGGVPGQTLFGIEEAAERGTIIQYLLSAAGQLCAKVRTGADRAVVEGLGSFLPVSAPVDCCESGSTLRFLIPIASLTGQKVTFVGRGRLMERPQTVYEKLYQKQSLRFEQSSAGLTVEGTLKSSEYELAGDVSSQFISGLLFALPLLAGDSTLHLIPPVESRSYIEMTRAAQRRFGVESRWQDENTLFIPGGQKYRPCDYTVEGDYSQAAFPAVLGAVQGGVTLKGLSADTLQGEAAILDILRRCGASIRTTDAGIVFEKAPLHGVDIDLADCPDLGPVLMVLGLLCEGTTTIRNAERLRIKESDRIAAMEAELRACGGVLESEGGTITIHGCADRLHAPAAPLHGHNDHRVVMSLAVLALAAGLVDWPFTLVRVFAFYPFYACGVLLRPQLARLAAFAAEHRPVRLVAAAGLVLGYGAYFLWVLRADPIMDHSAELFHDVSYAGGDRVQYRVVFYLVGIATTAALTVLASRWHLLAGLGRHTLTIYLLHLPVQALLVELGLYDLMRGKATIVVVLWSVLLAAVTLAVLNLSPVQRACDAVANCWYKRK